MKPTITPREAADIYTGIVGLPKPRPIPRISAIVPARSMAIADAYERMTHAPHVPNVKAAYAQLAREVSAQFQFLYNVVGLRVEAWTKPGQPYTTSTDMLADVLTNNHMFYFPTDSGYGDGAIADNPLLAAGESGLPLNDEFRVVHDYFGHGPSSSPFGPGGEESAWLNHGQTLTPMAFRALTTETRGQNSWVNFGPQMRAADGSLLTPDSPGYLKPAERAYAPQKTGLLPAWARTQ
jgi:hypothetical protein